MIALSLQRVERPFSICQRLRRLSIPARVRAESAIGDPGPRVMTSLSVRLLYTRCDKTSRRWRTGPGRSSREVVRTPAAVGGPVRYLPLARRPAKCLAKLGAIGLTFKILHQSRHLAQVRGIGI